MRPLVGWGLAGPSFTARDAVRGAATGEPTWDPHGLLRDLELRLGLPSVEAPASVRVPSWARRVDATLASEPFYARSFAADRIGTASGLLQWRDALVEAGWDGRPIEGGGDRLAALAKLESAVPDRPLPPGRADRLAQVEGELRRTKHAVYEELTLVEDREAWPARWRTIFDLLEQRGTAIRQASIELPGAAADSDLGDLQRMLRGERLTRPEIRGDGSLLVVRGDTSTQLAELTAAFLAKHGKGALVVRCKDGAPLESALARYGLARQGDRRPSKWRPAMQVLPLAIELAFEPRDPYRVLELLTLSVGPFRGVLGRSLARAVSRQPGIGGQEWTRQRDLAARLLHEQRARYQREREGKTETEATALADAYVAARLQRLEEWLERPGADPDGAPREHILAVGERVRDWLQKRSATSDSNLYDAAYVQARAFVDAVRHDPRTSFRLEEVRHLLDQLARGTDDHEVSFEEAGRIPHVAHPSAILAPADVIVAWGCVGGAEHRPRLSPWNAEERAALAAAGVVLQDPAQILRLEAAAWRRMVLAARERLVLVVPGAIDGEATSDHPLLDEIIARLGLEGDALSAIERHASTLLEAGGTDLVDVTTHRPLPLPEGRAEWTLAPELLVAEDLSRGAAATSIEKLASCPLAWVLEQRAKLRSGAIAKVASGPLLNGNLSHRLVEELHKENAFELDVDRFVDRASELLDRLFETEGATLLLRGASNERVQLKQQIVRAMRELHRYLSDAGFRIVAVEEQVRTTSTSATIEGRLDIRLADADGKPAVLDLKWGSSTYRKLLETGSAVQLAAYARALAAGDENVFPPAGYFAIATSRALSADERMKVPRPIKGPSLEDTWERVEATTKAVLDCHAKGRVLVLATRRSLPLLEALDIPEQEQPDYYAPDAEQVCKFCSFDGICGKAWEAIA
jgi:RecB family exonuclease